MAGSSPCRGVESELADCSKTALVSSSSPLYLLYFSHFKKCFNLWKIIHNIKFIILVINVVVGNIKYTHNTV